jgi:hypothetical protein
VYGLGVKVVDPPDNTRAQFRDDRWLEIQPGLAIDTAGNPIVVGPEPVENRIYHLATPAPTEAAQTVYLVLGYVDPETLDLPDRSVQVAEQFRIDERRGKLLPSDIELCRIELAPGEVHLRHPPNPFEPGLNELNLSHRHPAQLRPQGELQIGIVSGNNQLYQRWQALIESLPFLCPSLRCQPMQRVDLRSGVGNLRHDLLYVSDWDLKKWLDDQDVSRQTQFWSATRQFIGRGGTLLIEAAQKSPSLKAIFRQLVDLNGTAIEPVTLPHPVMVRPFRFGKLPMSGNRQIEMFYSNGFILVIGSLSEAWNSGQLDRQDIRAAQELGTNILHFVWQRRHLIELLR